jgi:hypothetical protein
MRAYSKILSNRRRSIRPAVVAGWPALNDVTKPAISCAQLTPSFFCRLVDDVVYWNTSRLSG